MIRALFLLAAALFVIGAREPILVPDVSQRNVDIVYSFTGAELLLFGAILYPDGRFPQRDADIAVVLKGPMPADIDARKAAAARHDLGQCG